MADASTAPTSPTGEATFSCPSTTTTAWHSTPPFEESTQLCTTLSYTPPTSEKPPHLHNHGPSQTLPDAPRIPLHTPSILTHTLTDLSTTRMHPLREKLWWSGPTPSIRPLSEHLTLERRIKITEDPTMHLVWTDNLLFLKPLPAYLCSHAFWQHLLDPANHEISAEVRDEVRAAALGFLRTYARLVQRRSDFQLAVRLDLLASFPSLSFESFILFIQAFDDIPDAAVGLRWRFGELSLEALNFYSLLWLKTWHRNRYESRYGAYFQRFFPVVLFMFALFSVILSAMQVILAARQPELWGTDNRGLRKTLNLFVWFGTEAIAWSLAFGLLFVFWWFWRSIAEAIKAHKNKRGLKEKLVVDVTSAA
ncbi:hypothetical protein EJ04DRAFT_510892 [Polyplosphaeria fusca]|uniref:Uncharacterized protein n=1 Tax=Polyplosphaeria fusca TaxID=682080 RepID=A0A9P4R4Y1_9PLEO|nr:hypothetical protein EJ04DRAFT_510892 [Polyplosphaeria fusca]